MKRPPAGNLPDGRGNPRCIYFLVTTVIRRLNVIRNVPTSAAPLSIKTITNGVQTVPLPELLTNLRERELLLSIPLSMKPTLLFAFCALVTLVSSAPAQAPQHNPAQAEVAALITEVRAQQAAIAANQVKINEKLATLAESIRVARIYSSRGGR